MKVRELIEILHDCDGDTEVLIWDSSTGEHLNIETQCETEDGDDTLAFEVDCKRSAYLEDTKIFFYNFSYMQLDSKPKFNAGFTHADLETEGIRQICERIMKENNQLEIADMSTIQPHSFSRIN